MKWLRNVLSSTSATSQVHTPAQRTTPLTPLSAAEQVILSYLNEPAPAVALLISGVWGAGKTHFFNTRKGRLTEEAGKTFVIVSVAGLETREHLDQAMFMAAAPWLVSGYTQALGVFAKAALRFAKIEPKDFKFAADLTSGKVAVVFDDVDRFMGNLKVLSGMIIDLLDHSRVHSIVIASEDTMNDGGFGQWRERVIGSTIIIEPDLPLMYDTFVNELASLRARSVLTDMRAELLSHLNSWRMGNLRVLRHAIRELSRVIDACEQLEQLGNSSRLLLQGLFIGLLEMKRDLNAATVVASIFSHKGLSEGAQGLLAGIELGKGETSSEEDSQFLARLISRYTTFEFSLFPGGDTFGDFFRRGVVDGQAMLRSFHQIAQVKTNRELFLSNYLKLSQADFDHEYATIVNDLKASAFRSMGILANIYLTLSYLSTKGAIPLTRTEIADLVVESTAGVPPQFVSDPDEADDFWFLEERDTLDSTVQRALKTKRNEAIAAATERERMAVFQHITDEHLLASRLQQWKARPLFIGAPERITEAITSLSPAGIREVIRLFGARRQIVNVQDFVRDEASTLTDVVRLLDAQLPAASTSLSIHQTQLRELRDVMREFLKRLNN